MTSHSLFAQFVHDAAERLAARLAADAPPDVREAYRVTAVSVLLERAAAVIGGERVYVPQLSKEERTAQQARIDQALSAGAAPDLIARQENVSASWVRKLRRRGTIGP